MGKSIVRLLSMGTWEFKLDERFSNWPLRNTHIILLLKLEAGFLLDSPMGRYRYPDLFWLVLLFLDILQVLVTTG